MSSRLQIYNDALMICGETALASLTENRGPRRLLDRVYDSGGINACLERSQWTFAMRSTRFDYATYITPDFGYSRAFEKPSDWILTSAVSLDEFFNTPLTQYEDEAGYWYADSDELYVRYVSNDSSYGGDLSLWPSTFHDFVASHFAAKIIFKLTQDVNKRQEVLDWEKRQLSQATSSDAMSGPTRFPPTGNWVRSRGGRNRGDRGNRGSLTG